MREGIISQNNDSSNSLPELIIINTDDHRLTDVIQAKYLTLNVESRNLLSTRFLDVGGRSPEYETMLSFPTCNVSSLGIAVSIHGILCRFGIEQISGKQKSRSHKNFTFVVVREFQVGARTFDPG
jgi:hypothetical protein